MDYYAPYKKVLSQSQMEVNAVWLRNYLQNRGWSLNAIAAALGNWESECTLNPNRPQRADFPNSSGGGFGLPQWTPWKKKYGALKLAVCLFVRAENRLGAAQLG